MTISMRYLKYRHGVKILQLIHMAVLRVWIIILPYRHTELDNGINYKVCNMGSVNAPDNSQYPTLNLNLESRFQKSTEWTSIPCWHQNTNNPSVDSNGMARSMWSNGPYYTACNTAHKRYNYAIRGEEMASDTANHVTFYNHDTWYCNKPSLSGNRYNNYNGSSSAVSTYHYPKHSQPVV